MSSYIVALNLKSRYRRPDVGSFIFMDAYERHVWKQTVASDIATLARLTNEALDFLRRYDQLDMHMQIVAVDALGNHAPTEEPADLLVPAVELPKKKRKLLLPTLPE
jgi:hypothetical protein